LSIKIAAIKGLQWAGKAAKPALPDFVKLLSTGDGQLRASVVAAIGSIPCQESAKILGKHLVADADYAVRCGAAKSLSQLGPQAESAAPALAKVFKEMHDLLSKDVLPDVIDSGPPSLKHPAQILDYHVGVALEKMGESAVPPLAPYLKDSNRDLRVQTLFMLGALGPKSRAAVPSIAALMEDPDPDVRYWAASTLSSIGPYSLQALPALNSMMRDPSGKVRIAAARAVLQLKPPSDNAVRAIVQGLGSREADVRVCAIHAAELLKLTDERILARLLVIAKADEDDSIRCTGLECLVALDLPPKVLVDIIEARLMDGSEEVHIRAVVQLGNVKESKLVVPLLVRALKNASGRVRGAATQALAKHGDEARVSLPELVKMIEHDPDINVRDSAHNAILRIKEAPKEENGRYK
jgi:HEAT repeat protein